MRIELLIASFVVIIRKFSSNLNLTVNSLLFECGFTKSRSFSGSFNYCFRPELESGGLRTKLCGVTEEDH